MPEGHKTHFISAAHNELFAEQILCVSSPQGRFRADARKVSGMFMKRVFAIGKHILYEFENGCCIHVHLGRYGKFRQWTLPAPEPIGQVRMRLVGEADAIDLNGPTTCAVINQGAVAALRNRLGPDPLAGGAKNVAFENITKSKRAVGSLLLDQAVIAGVGNIFRAELLFQIRLHPESRGCDLSQATLNKLWKSLSKMMNVSLKHGRIITVTAKQAGKPLAKLENNERFQIYGQPECPVCEQPIQTMTLGSRKLYWCRHCQTTKK